MTRKAACCCGSCSIKVEGEPALNAICHCSNCKRRTGSAFGWSTYFRDEQVTARTGDFGVYEIKARPQRRWFCAACGTTLFWKADGWRPSQTGIAGGCFIETPLPEPQVTVSDDGRCPWLGLPADWRTSI